MKKITLAVITITTLAGCAGPMGQLGRVWPDGASVALDEVTVNVSMTGAGSLIIKGVRWTGTNGFPIPGTNAPVAVTTTTLR